MNECMWCGRTVVLATHLCWDEFVGRLIDREIDILQRHGSMPKMDGARPRAVDDFDFIRDRLEAIRRDGGGTRDYSVQQPPLGTLEACECGRTTEKPEDSPCTGACGLPPGGRSGQGPMFNGYC